MLPVSPVEIIDIDDKGRGIGKLDENVYFVENAIPGDVVSIQPYRRRKTIYESKVLEYISRSKHLNTPHCQHFDECGGCRTQHITYETQVYFKEKVVKDAFERIAKIKPKQFFPILACEITEGYRNKLEFSFSNKRWKTVDEIADENLVIENNALGFHISGRFDKVLQIENCHHMADDANIIRNHIFDYALKNQLSFYDLKENTGLLRNIILRNTVDGEWMLVFSFGEDQHEAIQALLNNLQEKFKQLSSIYYCINTKLNDTLYDLDLKLFWGKDVITQKIGHIKVDVGPISFVQVNNYQTELLYNKVKELASLSPNDVLYDLFCGVGSIGLFLANECKEVIGIETVAEAIQFAERNKLNNNIENAQFITGSVENVLTDEFAAKYPKPDVIITDPPRNGMHPKVIDMLLKLCPKKIVYVSCKPSTQARDIALLSKKYELEIVQPVDMFPHTTHVESVAFLKLK